MLKLNSSGLILVMVKTVWPARFQILLLVLSQSVVLSWMNVRTVAALSRSTFLLFSLYSVPVCSVTEFHLALYSGVITSVQES